MYYYIDIAITGEYPQLSLRSGIYNNSNRPDFKKLNTDRFPESDLALNDFIYSPKATKTDVLSSNDLSFKIGIFINSKVKKVLAPYFNEYLKDYPIKINADNLFFIHIIDCYSNINYARSVFQDELNDRSEVQFSCFEEYCSKLGDTFITAKKICLKKKLDLFRLPFDTAIIVSEQLKNEIENAKISGITIVPYTYFDIE
jgi:hypothetical protein